MVLITRFRFFRMETLLFVKRKTPLESNSEVVSSACSPLMLRLAGLTAKLVHDASLGITVLFDPQSNLPNIIRSYEQHPFFGPSTHDLVVSKYIAIDGVQLPSRFKTVYNNKHLIGDYRADEVLVNSPLADGLFSVPGNGTIPEASVPIRDPE